MFCDGTTAACQHNNQGARGHQFFVPLVNRIFLLLLRLIVAVSKIARLLDVFQGRGLVSGLEFAAPIHAVLSRFMDLPMTPRPDSY